MKKTHFNLKLQVSPQLGVKWAVPLYFSFKFIWFFFPLLLFIAEKCTKFKA